MDASHVQVPRHGARAPVGPGRGSGAGSVVAYSLGITDLDPIKYNLLFERFLNPDRVSMPDFDIDFCMEGRDKVIDYVKQKYGSNSVSQIATFGTMAARAAIGDVGRVLQLPFNFVQEIAKLIPTELGITLKSAVEQEPRIKERIAKEEDVKELFDLAMRLEGLVRNVSMHAGGVLIAPTEISAFSPIYCGPNGEGVISQFDKYDVESVGLVKFDFLGLRTLTIINMALKNANYLLKKDNLTFLDLDEIPIDTGRGLVTGLESDYYKFKVPSIRNIEYSAPYMHDGRFQTLDQVINFYSIGIHPNSPNLDPLIEFSQQGGVQLNVTKRGGGSDAIITTSPRKKKAIISPSNINIFINQSFS